MFRAVHLESDDDAIAPSIRQFDDSDLPEGDVTIDVEYSTLNYKDGLAYSGSPGVVSSYPIVPGIDLAGVVAASDDSRYLAGDRVVVNGWRMGERHWGGHSERARVPAGWLVKLPESVDTRTAMAIGTAGFTSMLAVLVLERHGLGPDAGPVVVTGASGGVGSVAVSLLAGQGYQVTAVTGRTEEEPYLRALGAHEVIDRAELNEPVRLLQKQRWSGGIDAVGSVTLANVLASISRGGVVAACGNAQGMDLPTSVAPFILRGITLVGVDSVEVPHARRVEVWDRLSRDLDLDQLESMIIEIGLEELPDVAERILDGKVRGRVVVNVTA